MTRTSKNVYEVAGREYASQGNSHLHGQSAHILILALPLPSNLSPGNFLNFFLSFGCHTYNLTTIISMSGGIHAKLFSINLLFNISGIVLGARDRKKIYPKKAYIVKERPKK